jgi:cation diffusion facilitator CzcD-associated flavoprotein CzcO
MTREVTSPRLKTLDAVVVGAGLSGMYSLYRLRGLGLRVRAYDAAGDVGGTWWWNRYPGARVDSPGAPFYGYTFSKELAREWEWKETQPDQPAILRYLGHVADRFNLRKDIELKTRIESARWDPSSHRWRLTTSRGQVVEATFLISAVGTLSARYLPDIPGVDQFGGEIVHTGDWPESGLSFTGKRVGVIGTGSSGVQAIPFIAHDADHLYVFQRTPQYVLPGRNRPLDPAFAAETKENWAEYRNRIHATGRPFPTSRRRAVDATPEERQATYEAAWRRGGLSIGLTFSDHMADSVANGYISNFVRSKIRESVRNSDLAEKLIPTYLFGGKRLILGEDYYETFNRTNVTLVDLREDPIKCIDAGGVITKHDKFPLDVLVFATGYDALTGAIRQLNPIGVDGPLQDKWDDGVKTYLGLAVHGFPNMLMIHGPQTPSVKFHMALGAERQADWIARLIVRMREDSYVEVQPVQEAEPLWAEKVRNIASRTLYPLTDSWFSGANIPGKPREFMIHLDGPLYHRELTDIADNDYPGFVFTAADGRQVKGAAAPAS